MATTETAEDGPYNKLDTAIESLTLGESTYASYISSDDLSDLISAISHYSNTKLEDVHRTCALLELIEELKRRSPEITDCAMINREVEVLYKCLNDPEFGLSIRRTAVEVLVALLRKRHEDHAMALIEAISHYRDELEAINAIEENDGFTTISNLSTLMVLGFEEGKIYPKAEDLISILKNFVSRFDSQKERYHPLFDILIQILVITVDQEHSDDTIFAITQFLGLIPADHGERPLAFHAFYRSLCIRFMKDDIEETLNVHDIPSTLFDAFLTLAETLQRRSEETKVIPNHNLNGAILCLRATILLPEPNTDTYIKSKRMLGSCLLARYKTSNNADDLNEGNEHSMTYLVKEDKVLFNLAERFLKLFDEEQDAESLSSEIERYRAKLLERPPSHPERADTLLEIGYRLTALFKINGDLALLNRSMMYLREADFLSPKDGVIKMALALALLQKGVVSGGMQPTEDFPEIVNLMKETSVLLPEFGVTGTVDALISSFQVPKDDSVDELYSALSHNVPHLRGYIPVTKDPFERVLHLGERMRSFYTFTRDIQDIDGCIFYTRQTLDLCPGNHSKRPQIYHNLAEALFTRFTEQTKEEADLDESLKYYEMTMKILPVKNYLRAEYVLRYGAARLKKLELLQLAGQTSESEMEEILRDIIRQYKSAAIEATSSPIISRFKAAMGWAFVRENWHPEAALEAYNQAVSFLPRLTEMGTKLVRRLESVRDTDGVSRKAALNAISNGEYDKAIEFLEAGRAVFWQQTLQLRVPTDALRAAAPDLEARFSRISKELEKLMMQQEVQSNGSELERLMRDEEKVHIAELNEEWDQVLGEIQKLDGFSEFLLPKQLDSLQKCAKHPVIYLVPSEEDGHALIMLPDGVKHVHLPNASYRRLQGLMFRLPRGGRDVTDAEYDPYEKIRGGEESELDGHEREGRPVNKKVDRIKAVLEVLWHDVVSPIVGELGLTKESGSFTRVTWCPTGIFSFLPVHAAGIYRQDMSIVESAVEYFISSYTPTVGSIIQESRQTDSKAPFKMMVVTDPSTLPQTVHEMEVIEKHVPNNFLQKFGTKDSPALVDPVAENLSSVSIAHFACHGQQVTDHPLNSALKLKNGDLRISRIMEQRMQNAALAFLCACETAMGDRALPDEAMHLGATLLFSGFRSVVATMWSIDDPDGPVVADAFYAYLLKDDKNVPDVTLSAEGVHVATAELRRRGASFQRWVPFIHLGN